MNLRTLFWYPVFHQKDWKTHIWKFSSVLFFSSRLLQQNLTAATFARVSDLDDQDRSSKYQEKVNSKYIPHKDRKATRVWIKRQDLLQGASDHQKEGSSPSAALGETAKERTWARMHGRTEKWQIQKSLLPSLEVFKCDCRQSLLISSSLPVPPKVGIFQGALSTWIPLWL